MACGRDGVSVDLTCQFTSTALSDQCGQMIDRIRNNIKVGITLLYFGRALFGVGFDAANVICRVICQPMSIAGGSCAVGGRVAGAGAQN